MEIDDFMFDLNKKLRRVRLETLRKSNKYGRNRDTFIVSHDFSKSIRCCLIFGNGN